MASVLTRRERCIGIGLTIGGELATMLAGAVVLIAVAEAFHWASVLMARKHDG